MRKNRNRNKFTFANINLLGKCNFDCRWCLGKDLPEFNQYSQLSTHYNKWKNFEVFLNNITAKNIKQIYITGQNTDSLLYKYLDELIRFLKSKNYFVGIRTNGMLAEKYINTINKCNTCLGDAVSLTVLTLDKLMHKKIVGNGHIPNWKSIIPKIKVPLRVAIVIDRYNIKSLYQTIKFLSQFENIKYIQLRKISTDTRIKKFKFDMDLFEGLEKEISKTFEVCNVYESAKSYMIYGKECSMWRTVCTTANSINYYTNGVISDEYFIIEGYLKNK